MLASHSGAHQIILQELAKVKWFLPTASSSNPSYTKKTALRTHFSHL